MDIVIIITVVILIITVIIQAIHRKILYNKIDYLENVIVRMVDDLDEDE